MVQLLAGGFGPPGNAVHKWLSRETKMKKCQVIHWVRVLLSGWAAGVVFYLSSVVMLVLLGGSIQLGGLQATRSGLYFFSIDLAMGIWVVWVYTAIRQSFADSSRAAIAAGLAWWIIKSLQSAKWLGYGLGVTGVTPTLLASTLPAPLLAAYLGAWLYQRGSAPRQARPE